MGIIRRISQVAIAIIALVVIWYVIQGIRGCQKVIEEITTTVEEKEDKEWGKPREMEIKRRLFGQDKKPRLEITIPPYKDTIRLRIPGGEMVYGLPEDAQLHVVKYPPAFIRMKPSFHLSGLTDFSEVYFGVKIRVLEIWRFGLCGYIATCGPGIGCDFQLISNVSIGMARTLDGWYGELSIKL